MKKLLLCLTLTAPLVRAVAQTPVAILAGPWAEVNTTNVATPPRCVIGQLVALSPTLAWGLAQDTGVNSPYYSGNSSVRAANAAGTEFNFRPLPDASSYSPTNISVPAGVAGNTTAFLSRYSTSSDPWSEVVRTTDGGTSWRIITTATQFPSFSNAFCNWVHAFDADHVMAFGDPNNPITQFEIWCTSTASAPNPAAVVWTRASASAPSADEYGAIGGYAAVGDTVWAGTTHVSPFGAPLPVRILRSTDQGHTWTAHPTPLTLGEVQHLAFKDSRHGLAYTSTTTGTELIATADGGLTWQLQALPNPATADTVRGRFYRTGLTAIAGVGYVSYGHAQYNGRRSNFGASFSCDGRTWTDIDKGRPAGGYAGYLGSYTAASATPTGPGGLFQVAVGAGAPACAPTATARATARPALAVAPNPSADGHFEVQFEGVSGAVLTVVDALGRTVWRRELVAGTTAVSLEPVLHLGVKFGAWPRLAVTPVMSKTMNGGLWPRTCAWCGKAPATGTPVSGGLFNGLRYLGLTGCQWRCLPHGLPPWPAEYQQWCRWRDASVFERIVHDLNELHRVLLGRAVTPTAVVFDGRTFAEYARERAPGRLRRGQKAQGQQGPHRRRHAGLLAERGHHPGQRTGAGAGGRTLPAGAGNHGPNRRSGLWRPRLHGRRSRMRSGRARH